VLEAKHLLGQFLRSEPRFCAGRGMWLWLHKIRTENVREPAQAKKIEDLLLMKVFGRGLMTVRRRNIALVPRRKIRDRSETLAWAIFAQSHLFAEGGGCGCGLFKRGILSVCGLHIAICKEAC